MHSTTVTVQQIYQDRRQYRVPFYQRAYVWNREEQWGPLWEDIRDKAEARTLLAQALPTLRDALLPQETSRAAAEALAKQLGLR